MHPSTSAFPCRPPTIFIYEGQTLSAVSMMRDVMGFDPVAYKVMKVAGRKGPAGIPSLAMALCEIKQV